MQSNRPGIEDVRDVSNIPKIHYDFYTHGENAVIKYWLTLKELCAITPTGMFIYYYCSYIFIFICNLIIY